MKGITFVARGEAAFVEEAEPVCPEDGVLLRTLYSGLSNGTERNKLMGGNYHRGQYPDRIGYQHVSQVVAAGPQARQFAVGDVVFTGNFPGHVPLHACREEDLIVKLWPGADLAACALMAVAAVSYHNVKSAAVAAGDRVLVYGDGLIGQFAVQAVAVAGAEVTLAGHHADRLELARRAGAARVIDNRGEAGRQAVFDARPFNVVLECSGADVLGQIFGQGFGRTGVLTRPAKVMLVAGRREVNIDFNAGSCYHAQVFFSTHFTRADLHEVASLVQAGRLDLRLPLRETVPIEQALGVYRRLRDEPAGLLGTVFDWGAGAARESGG